MFAGSQAKGYAEEADRNSMAFPRSIDSKGKLVTTNMYGLDARFLCRQPFGIRMPTQKTTSWKPRPPGGRKSWNP